MQRLAKQAAVFSGGVDDQRRAWPDRHAWKHPLARLGWVIAQRPTGEIDRDATVVSQLDPVTSLAVVILQSIAISREKLIDDHLAKVVIGINVVMPTLHLESVRLRRQIAHTVVRHPGYRHDAILCRLELNLPRAAGNTSDRHRLLTVDS